MKYKKYNTRMKYKQHTIQYKNEIQAKYKHEMAAHLHNSFTFALSLSHFHISKFRTFQFTNKCSACALSLSLSHFQTSKYALAIYQKNVQYIILSIFGRTSNPHNFFNNGHIWLKVCKVKA